jgi:hypothetical protein
VGLNYAGEWGGGLFIFNSRSATLNNVEVTGNIAAGPMGGGIWCSGTVTISGASNIHDNVVSDPNGEGGGVYLQSGSIFFDGPNVRIGYNQATTGDGMYMVNGSNKFGTVTYEGGDQEVVGP